MLVNLFVRVDDIDKYDEGEKIVAADINGKSVIFKSHVDTVSVGIDSKEIVEINKKEFHGFVNGVFNEYYIQK